MTNQRERRIRLLEHRYLKEPYLEFRWEDLPEICRFLVGFEILWPEGKGAPGFALDQYQRVEEASDGFWPKIEKLAEEKKQREKEERKLAAKEKKRCEQQKRQLQKEMKRHEQERKKQAKEEERRQVEAAKKQAEEDRKRQHAFEKKRREEEETKRREQVRQLLEQELKRCDEQMMRRATQ